MTAPAIIIFADSGLDTAKRIALATGGGIHTCGQGGADALKLLPRLFSEGTPIIGVCAAGILIRLLASSLENKQKEPPVLAVSQDGLSIVPLLGGHRGANRLARDLAEALGGIAAITTASDAKFLHSLDEPPAGWVLGTPQDAKPAMMALLLGAKLQVEGSAPFLAEAGYPVSSLGSVKVLVTEQKLRIERGIVYHPKTLVAGVGCERGAEAEEVIALIDFALAKQNLAAQSLAAIASIDIKADEPALLEAARHFQVPLRLFSAAELSQERYRLKSPSDYVEETVGTPSVAEAAALKAGPLLVEKLKSDRATCAIGKAIHPIDPNEFGRRPGVLHLVGIGPGEPISRTASAVNALEASTDWVGYGLYLDLVADLRRGQSEHRYDLGEEEPRVRHALELAAQGKVVSLICSGDAQIYAMAALAYELLDATGPRAVSDVARRVNLETHPGISAFQAASAAAGALIGHDFCCISLSDLLTPRDDILKRLEGAARADFVTALYNPRSQRRVDLIEQAKRLFMDHRPPSTPVVIGSNLGRPNERVRVVELAAFDPTEIDMLTIVIIGASTSRAFHRGSGTVAYTPRGYEAKTAEGSK
ncbi:MAG: cobalt-precorrin hydrolase [Devosia sp.]|uniref:cobalamin biosynthesis protein n=1 Tax=Devosia sp. TaxID=1871048 RepID=UPI002612E31D|nr:cobalamin biosynthesis protein [Devosia sp.]MDB5539876.1 cobalt-precorrin hydrolase [Devosia sp.]